GQGSGPAEIDQLELAALGKYVPRQIPLTTPLLHFGHTNGTSGLLSIALAVLRQGASTGLPSLCMEAPKASDGRPLLAKAPRGVTLVLGRALSGACAAATVLEEAAPTACRKPVAKSWRASGVEMALSHPLLRKLACEAREKRDPIRRDLLVASLGQPIVPRLDARIGGKLLTSAILE